MTEHRLKVFRVEDGERHWIVARHEGEAAGFAAEAVGMTRSEYAAECAPELVELTPFETLRLWITDWQPELESLPETERAWCPPGANLHVQVTATAQEWADHNGEGVLGSTCT